MEKNALVQFKAFRLDGKYLIAVGNFWQRGEHFFTLKVKGLKGDFHASIPGCSLGKFTASELARGILLQVGALRWQFVSLTPAQECKAPLFTQSDMKKLLERRRPAIEKALAAEKRLYEKRMARQSSGGVSDLSGLTAVENESVEATPEGRMIRVRAPGYALSVDPSQAGRIAQWEIGGESIVKLEKEFGFAVPGLMAPKALIFDSAMKAESLKAVPGGVELRLSRMLNVRRDKIGGLQLTQTFFFGKESFKVKTLLKNCSDDASLDVVFRYHNIPELLGQGAEAVFADGKVFRRNYVVELFRMGPQDKRFESKFRVTPAAARDLTLKRKGYRSRVRLSFPEGLRYVMFWDDARQRNSTLEPVFSPVMLPPEKIGSWQMDVRCGK